MSTEIQTRENKANQHCCIATWVFQKPFDVQWQLPATPLQGHHSHRCHLGLCSVTANAKQIHKLTGVLWGLYEKLGERWGEGETKHISQNN